MAAAGPVRTGHRHSETPKSCCCSRGGCAGHRGCAGRPASPSLEPPARPLPLPQPSSVWKGLSWSSPSLLCSLPVRAVLDVRGARPHMGAPRDHPFCTRLLRGSSGLGLPAAQGCAGTPGREQSWQLCAVPLGSLWRSQMLARQRMGRRRAPGRAAEELGRDTRPSTAQLPEELPHPTAGAVQAGRYLPGVSPAPSRCPCSLPTMGRRVPAATGTNLHRHGGQGARRAAPALPRAAHTLSSAAQQWQDKGDGGVQPQ